MILRTEPVSVRSPVRQQIFGLAPEAIRACLSVRLQGFTPTPQYRPSASSRLWPARPAALCLPDPCGLGSDSHGDKAFWGKLLESLTQTGSKCLLPASRKPLPMYGAIEGRVQPQQACEMRVSLCDLADGVMRHMRDRARGERHNAVVHPLEDEAVQIDEVARDMDGADPALAVAQDLVAPREALQEELALARTIPLPHHILALFDG